MDQHVWQVYWKIIADHPFVKVLLNGKGTIKGNVESFFMVDFLYVSCWGEGWVMYIGYSDGKRLVNLVTVSRLGQEMPQNKDAKRAEKLPGAVFPVSLVDFFFRSALLTKKYEGRKTSLPGNGYSSEHLEKKSRGINMMSKYPILYFFFFLALSGISRSSCCIICLFSSSINQ